MKTRFFSLFVALIATASVFADDFQSGDLYYNITSDSTVEVYGNGNGYRYTSVIIPESVTYEGTTYSITSIRDYAFYECESLTSVTIPNSVTSIGWDAFSGCSGLTSVTIPNSVTYIGGRAFYGTPWLDGLQNGVIYIGNILYKYKGEMPQGTKIIVKEGTICICGSAFSDCTGLTSITIPDGVTSIEGSTFSGCTGLTSITIPNSVTSIGSSAFSGCTGLTSVTIPNSVTSIGSRAFSGCTGLTSVTIPNSVTSIGDQAFVDCTGLTSITIPNSVTNIGDRAFEDCTGLTSITIPNSVTSIGYWAFGYVPNIVYSGTETGAPWGARSMNGYVDGYLVYSDATKKTLVACSSAATGNITIPNSVTSIGEYAFYGCSGLTSVTIPNSVTSIGENAFAYCSGLTSITIPNSATSIGDEAFWECSGLTSVSIPNSVTSIGMYAFFYCSSLTSIVVESGNTAYDSRNNCNAIVEIQSNILIAGCQNTTIPNSVTSIAWGAFGGCSGLTSITIPNSITSIGGEAFMGCSGLTSVTIPNSVTSIEPYAFCSCSSLTSVTIPNSVTSIGEWAFDGCSGLTSITIPNSVTSIGMYAFYDCEALTSVTCYAIEPPQAYYSFGYGIDSIPLYVPIESIEKYKVAEEWKDFKEILPISAMPADADEPVIDPESTTVTITWPATDKAATYTIEISKDGALVCTLTFDANGVLQNMRFATPARHAAQHTTQAEATGSGFRFVVEGLDYATTYTYTITAKDTEDKVVESYNGTFTTTAPTSTEDVHSTPSRPAVRKVFRNGQVYILRGDKIYTLTGEEL